MIGRPRFFGGFAFRPFAVLCCGSVESMRFKVKVIVAHQGGQQQGPQLYEERRTRWRSSSRRQPYWAPLSFLQVGSGIPRHDAAPFPSSFPAPPERGSYYTDECPIGDSSENIYSLRVLPIVARSSHIIHHRSLNVANWVETGRIRPTPRTAEFAPTLPLTRPCRLFANALLRGRLL